MATKSDKGQLVKKTVNKGGRPVGSGKWKEEYNKAIVAFFDVEPYKKEIIGEQVSETIKPDGTKRVSKNFNYRLVPNSMPTFEDFAASIEVTKQTLYNWADPENVDLYPGFFDAFTRAHELQRRFIVENGFAGVAPPAAFVFVAKAVGGMRDGDESKNTNINVVIAGIREQAKIAPIPVDNRNLLPH